MLYFPQDERKISLLSIRVGFRIYASLSRFVHRISKEAVVLVDIGAELITELASRKRSDCTRSDFWIWTRQWR